MEFVYTPDKKFITQVELETLEFMEEYHTIYDADGTDVHIGIIRAIRGNLMDTFRPETVDYKECMLRLVMELLAPQ